MRYLGLTIVIFLCGFNVFAAPLGNSKFRVPPEPLQAKIYDIPINAYQFTQKLDHEKRSDRRTFKQNYWVSPGYSASENSPVILYFCGETACDPSHVKYMFPWAEKIGAYVVVMEHRYYGASQPFAQNTTENLRWMTMTQALVDFAEITNYLKAGGLKGPWIVSGGSYAGMIASAMRQKYPDLFNGAWASSAPLNVVSDYQGYDIQMVKNISPACAESIRKVTVLADIAVADEATFKDLREKFQAAEMTDAEDFLFGIIDVAAAAVQYGWTPVLCDSFVSGDVMNDYANFLSKMANDFGYLPSSYSFSSIMDTTAGAGNSDLRTFIYQQCNEYGLFQTAYVDPAVSLRSQRLNMDYMRRGCARAFGKKFSHDTTPFTDCYYKPLLGNEHSEIYFTNGDLDPWTPLGIASENGNWSNPGLYAVMLKDAYHCDDLSFRKSTTRDSLKGAAAIVTVLLRKWAL